MIGHTFHDFTVISIYGTGTRGTSWNCQCVCGKVVKIATSAINGRKNCGCKITDHSDKVIHPTKEQKRAYRLTIVSWKAMLARCYYSKDKQQCYENVTICEEWFTFTNFLRDVGERPSFEHSLDREDPDKGYNKDNCRWITKAENCSRARITPRRLKAVSDNMKGLWAEGRIKLSEEGRKGIAAGGVTRTGRKKGTCSNCGEVAYTKLCQRCRGKRAPKE